jgi:sec-independent protein translocase protein TatA
MFGSIGMPEMMVILVIALIIFGPGKLPELGNLIGKTLRGFRQAMEETETKSADSEEVKEDETKKG